MRLWRIAAETRRYAATDLSGRGAASYPGRWNDEGLPATWAAIPAGPTSIKIGSDWLKLQASAILLVPSVIVPED